MAFDREGLCDATSQQQLLSPHGCRFLQRRPLNLMLYSVRQPFLFGLAAWLVYVWLAQAAPTASRLRSPRGDLPNISVITKEHVITKRTHIFIAHG